MAASLPPAGLHCRGAATGPLGHLGSLPGVSLTPNGVAWTDRPRAQPCSADRFASGARAETKKGLRVPVPPAAVPECTAWSAASQRLRSGQRDPSAHGLASDSAPTPTATASLRPAVASRTSAPSDTLVAGLSAEDAPSDRRGHRRVRGEVPLCPRRQRGAVPMPALHGLAATGAGRPEGRRGEGARGSGRPALQTPERSEQSPGFPPSGPARPQEMAKWPAAPTGGPHSRFSVFSAHGPTGRCPLNGAPSSLDSGPAQSRRVTQISGAGSWPGGGGRPTDQSPQDSHVSPSEARPAAPWEEAQELPRQRPGRAGLGRAGQRQGARPSRRRQGSPAGPARHPTCWELVQLQAGVPAHVPARLGLFGGALPPARAAQPQGTWRRGGRLGTGGRSGA